VIYSTTGTTNQNVLATLTGCNESIIITNNSGNAEYTFTGNGFFLYSFVDLAGNPSVAPAIVTWIDKTMLTGTINYTPNTATSGDVEVIITLSKQGTITGRTTANNLIFTKVFTGNTSGTVTFSDLAGNSDSTGFNITRIDKTPPTGTISYNPNTTTNRDVVVILTTNEPIQPLSGRTQSGGDQKTRTRTYPNNIPTTNITFYDLVGNAGTTTIEITRIHKKVPTVQTMSYTPNTATSGDVMATMTTDKSIQRPTGRSGNATGTIFTKVYGQNTDESFIITDLVGNTGQAKVSINQIDKIAPQAINVSYTPTTTTNTDVVAILETSERVRKPNGRKGNATGTIFTKVYTGNTTDTVTFYDQVYNSGSTGIVIHWIDKTVPTGMINYTPSTPTSGNVQASIGFTTTGVTILNNSGSTNYLFTDNGTVTFEYQDNRGVT
jgi:hypothetical protein